MKKFFAIALTVLVAMTTVSAQSQKDIFKERKQMAKLTKTELDKRASKAARAAAKTYAKQKWAVPVGALPLEKQLDKAYNMQYQFETADLPMYVMGEATAIGQNYDAAKMQALELAKINLAGQMQTEITALIESSVANEQISSTDAASISKSVMSSKSLISQTLGRVIPVVECYRDTNNGMKEVRVQVAYSYKAAADAARSIVKAELEKSSQNLAKQLDQVLGF